MGMFDVDLSEVQTSNQPYGYTSLPMQLAYAGAGGMVKAAGNALGFQDEEDLMQEIYDNADFTTMEGRQAAVAAVMKISPEKGAELQTQLNEASQAEASTNAMNIDVENSKIKRATALFTPMLQTQFANDVTVDGERAAIHMWLSKNQIPFEPADVITTAQATTIINKFIGTGSSSNVKDFNEFVAMRRSAYVTRGIYEKAGLTPQSVESTGVAVPSAMADLTNTSSSSESAFVTKAKNYNADDSQWTSFWKEAGRQQALVKALQRVNTSMINFGLETFMSATDKKTEDREDKIQKWIGGGNGAAQAYFYGKDPAELDKFVADPIGYYERNIATPDDDLFKNSPYI
tara:strand:- start:193 stop:1230 length:1038 start_codon:yes stop_codon:yes gene_type:complete